MRKRLANIFATVVLLGVLGLAHEAYGSSLVRVQVTAINCSQNGDLVPDLFIARGLNEFGPTTKVAERQLVAAGVNRLVVMLPPGRYYLEVVGKKCEDFDAVTVLRGIDRHIVFHLSPTKVISEESCSVAGTLPVSGLRMDLVRSNGKVQPVTIDGNAYYVEHVSSAKHHLRVYLAKLERLEVDADTSKNCHLIRNITIDDLRGAQ